MLNHRSNPAESPRRVRKNSNRVAKTILFCVCGPLFLLLGLALGFLMIYAGYYSIQTQSAETHVARSGHQNPFQNRYRTMKFDGAGAQVFGIAMMGVGVLFIAESLLGTISILVNEILLIDRGDQQKRWKRGFFQLGWALRIFILVAGITAFAVQLLQPFF